MLTMKIASTLALCGFLIGSSGAYAEEPVKPCLSWPLGITWGKLKNEGYVTPEDYAPNSPTAKLLAFGKVKKNLYRQVYLLTYSRKSKKPIYVITTNDVNNEECSAGPVEVFLIEKTVCSEPDQLKIPEQLTQNKNNQEKESLCP
ncbi:hypothetical protein [Acetobacter thailandicus]|uniref:hypothetical protein n=1 Tax=Acetobacter thailandicus TaxID=1502842 RepID=UPI001BAA7EE9|nr:hypothetical protein [Acetobacter thailandicus]MBS1002926.1 hypothetical protein [Acetobacter thailandicus]